MNPNDNKELWTRSVPEIKYLNTDNVARYRLIMRLFYENHSKLKYWLKAEEVYEGVMQWELLPDYQLEQCQRDLETLAEWNNLTNRHDGGRASSIEEYLRKRFRYQMTPYSIEIERMLESLEHIKGYGGSLEPTLLERIVAYVVRIREESHNFAEGEALLLWRDLQGSFRQLHESASDFLASLQTGKAEELMLTEQFLIYKDTLTYYLRNFIISLQRNGGILEGLLQSSDAPIWHAFLHAVVADEQRMPTLDNTQSDEELMKRREEEWTIFTQWFVGSDRESSDMIFLERSTKDSIARMLKYALAIQEKFKWGISRKKELDYLGQWFLRLADETDEAHRLGAYTFSLYTTRHYQGEGERTSDSADISMWDELPIVRELKSRSRIRKKAGETESIRDPKEQQMQAKEAILASKALEDAILQTWIARGEFKMNELNELNKLSVLERRILLVWISRCIANRSRTTRTPDGLEISLKDPVDSTRARLEFEDGLLELPNFLMTVKEVVLR